MKERPILFSGPMVRAILEARKTQTRRVIKPQAWAYSEDTLGQRMIYPRSGADDFGDSGRPIRYPYGVPGDRLWVRETWRAFDDGDVFYRADFGDAVPVHADDDPAAWMWRPSIYMPRWASRITLEVTGVRVERVQEISEDDARAEGPTPNWCGDLAGWDPEEHGYLLPGDENADDDVADGGYYYTGRWAFAEMWDSINAKRGHPWASNPWVWVIEFGTNDTGQGRRHEGERQDHQADRGRGGCRVSDSGVLLAPPRPGHLCPGGRLPGALPWAEARVAVRQP